VLFSPVKVVCRGETLSGAKRGRIISSVELRGVLLGTFVLD
jgi:hypothetical protein